MPSLRAPAALVAVLVVPAVAAAAPDQLGTGDRPWVIVDRQGVTHVVWEQNEGLQSTLTYRRRLPGAAAFEPARILPVGAGQDFAGAQIVQEPAPGGRLVIVADRCCTTPGTFALTSADNGATWSAPAPVFEGSQSVNQLNGRVPLTALSATTLFLVIGNPAFRLAQVPAALAPVTPASAATGMGGSPYDTQVALDEAGGPVFAWTRDFTATFLRPGVTGPDVPVATAASGASIHIAGGPRGVGVVTLGLVSSGGATTLEYRRWRAGALSGPVVLSGAGEPDPLSPFVATDQAGRFHVVWRRGDTGIAYRRSEDGTGGWTRPVVIAGDGSSVFDLVAAGSTTAGEPGWAVWEDGSGSTSRILAAPLTGSAVTDGPSGGLDDPALARPDTRGITAPRVTRNGPALLVAPRRVSLRSIRRSKCVRVRVQSRRPATVGVAIFSGVRSRRVFGRATVVFRRPGKRVVCVRVPLRARTFDVRQPFRFAFAVREGAPGAARRGPVRERTSPVFRFLP